MEQSNSPWMRLHETAFLFLDFQRDVCDSGGGMVKEEQETLARFKVARGNGARLLGSLRKIEPQPLTIHVNHLFSRGYPEIKNSSLTKMEEAMRRSNSFVEGEERAKNVPELQPMEGEFLLKKHTLSPFASSELGWLLNKNGIRSVVLSGVVTQYAILSAAFAAYDHGYYVSVARDCCMSGNMAMHETSLKILESIARVADGREIMEGFESHKGRGAHQ